MKIFLSVLFSAFILSSYGQATDYDTTFTGASGTAWNAVVHLPASYYANTTDSFQGIVFFVGSGEVGTDTSLAAVNGPNQYIRSSKHWPGQATLGNGVHDIILITIQPPASFQFATLVRPKIDAILARYKILRRKRSFHLCGVSNGGWQSNQFICYQATTSDSSYAQLIASVVNVEGVIPDDADGAAQPYPMKFHVPANCGLKYWGFEQSGDNRDIPRLVRSWDTAQPNTAVYQQTSFGSTGHGYFNYFFGGFLSSANGGDNTTQDAGTWVWNGVTQNIYQFMLRQGDTVDDIHSTTLTAHAGGTITRGDSVSFDVLKGSQTGGTPPYTVVWRNIAKPNGNDWCANVLNPGQDTTEVIMTGVFSSPFGTAYKYELTVTDAASHTAKDTAIINVAYATTSPPQATGAGFHYVTSADSIAADGSPATFHQMSPHRKDVWINGANTDAYNRNVSIDLRNVFAMHDSSRLFISAGKYFHINLYLNKDSILCDSLNPGFIVPFGGQVEWFDSWVAGGCYKNLVMTGRYDSILHIGSPSFRGHANGNYAFSSGTYGFYANNHWTNIDAPGMDFGNAMDSTHNMELSYIEGPHGGAYFLLIGRVGATTDVYSYTIANNYGVDSRSEMNYWLRTQGDPQQTARNFNVYNNRFVRSGLEDDQFGQNGQFNHEHNNVYFMSAMNWISPFESNQAFNNQRFYRKNANSNEMNFYIGAGEQIASLIANKATSTTLTTDTNYLRKDVFFNGRGSKDVFLGSQNAGAFNFVFDSCYFGYRPHIYLASKVYSASSNNFSPNPYAVLQQQGFTPPITIAFRHVRYDTSGLKTRLDAAASNTTYTDTARAVLNPFNPVNSGFPDNTILPNIAFRWADTIGRTYKDEDPSIPDLQQGTAWFVQAGQYVFHLGWCYLCKVTNTSHAPAGVEDTWWHPVTWTRPDGSVTHTPPDDLRLPVTDFYAQQKIGLLDQFTPAVTNPPIQIPVGWKTTIH